MFQKLHRVLDIFKYSVGVHMGSEKTVTLLVIVNANYDSERN